MLDLQKSIFHIKKEKLQKALTILAKAAPPKSQTHRIKRPHPVIPGNYTGGSTKKKKNI